MCRTSSRLSFTLHKCSSLTFSCWSSCCAISGWSLPFVSVLLSVTSPSAGYERLRTKTQPSAAIKLINLGVSSVQVRLSLSRWNLLRFSPLTVQVLQNYESHSQEIRKTVLRTGEFQHRICCERISILCDERLLCVWHVGMGTKTSHVSLEPFAHLWGSFAVESTVIIKEVGCSWAKAVWSRTQLLNHVFRISSERATRKPFSGLARNIFKTFLFRLWNSSLAI